MQNKKQYTFGVIMSNRILYLVIWNACYVSVHCPISICFKLISPVLFKYIDVHWPEKNGDKQGF